MVSAKRTRVGVAASSPRRQIIWMKGTIKQHPVLSFMLIAFGWTWPPAALIRQSMVFPLLALFGPCVAAIVVLYASQGREGLTQLGNKFRLSWALAPWCTLAALLPIILLFPLWLFHSWFWGSIRFEVSPVSLLSLVVAVFIVGEEIGWRGFLLPHLLKRYPPLISSLIVGLIWAAWHLPNFLLPNYPHYGLPFAAFAAMTVAFSTLFTWFHLNTSGSLLVAVIFHAALNLFSLAAIEPSRQYWLKAFVYGVAAVIAVAVMPSRSESFRNRL